MEDSICTGCGMTEKESNTWYKLSDEERLKIVERLATRKNASTGGDAQT
ncbi:MAG: DUF1289 domain-containing protein [Gammaproteobacteria bacterium]|nr:DUF1289 domain-containing protein [Gammaproteobacteria bacterium]